MTRLDQLLVDRSICTSLKEAAGLILSGQVLVDDRVVDKPGTLISSSASIRTKQRIPYVSRGGIKLQGGLDHFAINPEGWVCIDVGASTGGFTDCLLQAGASLVYAVDVAYGILDWKLRSDPRVVVMERCNARYLQEEDIPESIDLCVIDTSFISLTKLIPPMISLFGDKMARILALVKPQFELERTLISAGGIVAEESLRLGAVKRIEEFCTSYGLKSHGFTESPIRGAKGNQEYLLYLSGR